MATKKKTKPRTAHARTARHAATPRVDLAQAATATAARAAPTTVATADTVTLQRVSKGRRPRFHDSEAVDQLFAIVTALTAELSVAFDRIDTVERLLVGAGALTADCVESYQPSDAAVEARSARREALIQRVFAVFEAYGAPQHS